MEKMDGLTASVREWIEKYEWIQAEDMVVVGFSGGVDSVCLLSVLSRLAGEMGFCVAALHVHHGIRGQEADEDARFCREFCAAHGIACRVVRADIPALARKRGLSVEETARQVRYAELEKERERLSARWIAVAHHRDDNAETVLWNLFRGSGLKGLAGIRPVSGRILRPFLGACAEKGGVGRDDLERYAGEHNLPWRVDATNEEDHYTRNRIRHHILPYAAEKLNSQAVRHICQAAGLAGEADAYLEKQAAGWLLRHGMTEIKTQAESRTVKAVTMDVGALAGEERILQTYIVREACRRAGGLTDLAARHVEAVLGLLETVPGGRADRSVQLSGGLTARRSYDVLTVERPPDKADGEKKTVTVVPPDPAEGMQTVAFGETCFVLQAFAREKEQKIPANRYTKWLDYDTIQNTLAFRTRRTGDYILLAGGRKKTVKAYMIDEKIPADKRDSVILAACGSHVLWIVGYRLSEGAKITDDTKNVLQISVYGGRKNGKDSRVDP